MGRERHRVKAGRESAVNAALLVGLLLAATAASAQQPAAQTLYSCVANGRTYTGDRPPPECASSDIRELNRDGSLRRVIARPLTAEEQRARALEAKKKLEDEEKALAQRRRDRSLLEAYANEDEIEIARVKALDTSKEIVRRSQARIERMDAERKRLDEESEFYRNRQLPDSIKRAYANNEQEKTAELKIVKEARVEMQRINERFDAERKRFRELVAQGSQPVQRNPEPDIMLDPRYRTR